MIWRLLKKNISAKQIAGYAISAFVGLSIIITAIKFYGDLGGALSNKDKEINDYMILSIPVSMFDTFGFGGTESGISQKEIDDLAAQPWAENVGAFTPANFNVTASVDINGQGIWSYVFMEAVPDSFLDVNLDNWGYNPNLSDQEIPIVVPRDYLALYNFGFAGAHGLPQMSESLVSSIIIDLYVSGNGHAQSFKGRIVGFSDRLNTIAVPADFIKWANSKFSNRPAPEPSRLIVEVNNPGDPAIEKYLKKHALIVANDKVKQGRAKYLLSVATAVVVAIGAAICILSLFILMLSITLLLQKNREKNAYLLLLGYSPMQVSKSYFALVGYINGTVLALAIVAMILSSSLWKGALSSLQMEPSSAARPILCAIIIMGAITCLNFLSIYRDVRKVFRN